MGCFIYVIYYIYKYIYKYPITKIIVQTNVYIDRLIDDAPLGLAVVDGTGTLFCVPLFHRITESIQY